MGVELGKVLAKKILAQLDKPDDVKGHDGSVRDFFIKLSGYDLFKMRQTTGLIHYYQKYRKE